MKAFTTYCPYLYACHSPLPPLRIWQRQKETHLRGIFRDQENETHFHIPAPTTRLICMSVTPLVPPLRIWQRQKETLLRGIFRDQKKRHTSRDPALPTSVPDPEPDPSVGGMNPDTDPSIIKQK
jgi:hypothetical protein